MPARKPVPAPNSCFIGRETAFRAASRRLRGTIIVIWVESQEAHWIALTDLDPSEAGGVLARAPVLDRDGIQGVQERGAGSGRKTRRTDPARVERRCPVLAAATLLTLAAGSRVEDAHALKKSPSALRSPPKAAPERNRIVGVFRLGLAALSHLPAKGGMWRGVRLPPEPRPPPPDGLEVV